MVLKSQDGRDSSSQRSLRRSPPGSPAARPFSPPAGALQVAAGLGSGATAFVTNDHSLPLLQGLINVVILDDYRPSPQV